VGPLLAAFAGGTFLVVLTHPGRHGRARSAAGTLFGYIYVPFLFGHLVFMRDAGASGLDGAACVFLVFLLTWCCDTGAYAFGRAVGRRRPWPTLSPRKSLEGAAGGLVAAAGAALLARAWFVPVLTFWEALGLGLLVGGLCQAGDLFESGLKRAAGVKDSSSLIPGHGGVLDRFDSMFLSAPATYYFLRVFAASQ
jgi:phosphatidate cytidylyltransferase